MRDKLANNKGSTLILLVMSIAILSLLGTTILGVTMMNYKIKQANSDMKYSFYMSESGLDRAYAEAYTVIMGAVDDANTAAQNVINSYDINKLAELSLNPEAYTNIIEDTDGDGIYEYKQEYIKTLAKAEFELVYVDTIKSEIMKSLMGTTPEGDLADGVLVNDDFEKLKLDINEVDFDNFDKDTPMILSISSEYTKKKVNITKTTEVDLIIKVPDYNDSFTVETVTLELNPFWTKVMTAENLNIDKQGDTVFNGEVFVHKNLNLNGSGRVTFNNDLAVKSNIEIQNNKELITKNVYTSNILLNGEYAKFSATTQPDSSVDYEGVVVLDDLEMNARGQKVTINGSYYGFGYGGVGVRDNVLNSSIIINNRNIEGLTINKGNLERGNLYLLGTSYIKGISPYATGESLSVLGNYVAYTNPLDYKETVGGVEVDGKYDNDNVEFNYESYMPYFPQLVEWFIGSGGTRTEMQAYEKAEYIKKYQELGGSSLQLLGGKIQINDSNIVTLGSVIDGEFIKTSNAPLEVWQDLNEDIGNTFETKINKLGFEYSEDGSNMYSTDEIFDNIPLNFNNEIKNGTELLYINKVARHPGDGKKYVITDDVSSGLIITNEDIDISGTVDFTGVIICAGDINILDDGGSKTFKYNKGIVSKIISEHNLHETVFVDTTNVGMVTITSFSSGGDVNVDFNPLLEFNNWEMK